MASQASGEAFDPNTSSVKHLRQFLRDRGEYISGRKQELIERAKGTIELERKPLKEIECKDIQDGLRRQAQRFVTSLGEQLPNPASLSSGWTTDIDQIPAITEKDLYNYLVLNSSRTFDSGQMKANRALKAKVFFKDGHVHSLQQHTISESCTHCFVKCKVMPSVSTQDENKKPDYDVWLCMSKVSGQVQSAGCNCSAGEGESCSHIAGLLYGLVDLTEQKEEGLNSSTSIECWWLKPRKRKLSPMKSEHLTFRKYKFNDENIPARQTSELQTPNVKPVNVELFAEKLMKCNRHAAWLCSQKHYIPNFEEKSIPLLHCVKYMYRDSIDLTSKSCVEAFKSYFFSLSVSETDAEQIRNSTKGQSGNTKWFEARKGRITSSQFGPVCKRKDSTEPGAVLKNVMGYSEQCDVPSVRWGKSHERAARKHYCAHNKKKHLGFQCAENGLIVNADFPHLGASPDGFVSCQCCGEGLLEIKCPFKWRFNHPSEACTDNKFYCSSDKGDLKLNRHHSYFYQIQGQMALCQKNYCDFFIWTLKGHATERLYFDQEFWENCVFKLNSFFLRFVIPEVFSERVKRGIKLYDT